MYCVNKNVRIDDCDIDLVGMDGFVMASKKKIFHIANQNIKSVKIVNKKLAKPLVCAKVEKKYSQLIKMLTDLLVSDDDTGENFNIVLNEIEKFRLEIKNKYRNYLDKEELEKMAKQLKIYNKEAKTKYMEICSELNNKKSNGKGK